MSTSPSVRFRLFVLSLASLCTVCVVAFVSTPALAASDANRTSCAEFPGTEASPGFMTYLPDCRAVELVTPPYEGGSPALWLFKVPPPVSSNGEHLLGQNFAGGAGAENDEAPSGFELGAIYEFSRTLSGWSTESLEPPASVFARRQFVTASADLSRSLWKLVVQSGAGEEVGNGEGDYSIDVREAQGAGGLCRPGSILAPRACFTGVGPAHPPQSEHELEPRGASHDLTHIVLGIVSASGELWPGDETRVGGESLYEYLGTGNREPVLVGVKNAEPLEGKPHLNENAELVSECGTLLGSAGATAISAYNAVSADGAIVYFTALHGACSSPEVNELYARVDGSKTVAISEPSREDCGECIESGKADAVFQGASEDGSKVFFTTEQELLPEQKADNLYEYDFDAEQGRRIKLVSAGAKEPQVQGVARISEDGSHVYFLAKEVLTATPNGNGEKAEEDGYNLYGYDTETKSTAFVAVLLSKGEGEGLATGEIESRTGVTVRDKRRPFEATPNGQFLVFVNARQLTGVGDTSTVSQVFEYDAQTERLVRVSAGQKSQAFPAGYNDNGNTTNTEDAPSILAPDYSGGMEPFEAASALSLAEDGSVVFTSRDALAPGAVLDAPTTGTVPSLAAAQNIYEYREGGVYLISPANVTAPLQTEQARLLGTDQSGGDVFFFTADSLVPQDTDTQASWYDARLGGGFPAPVSFAGCAGDACLGPLSATPFLPSASGSATQVSGENLPPPAVSKTVVKPRSKPLTRAQKLTKALKACKKKPRRRRAGCAKQAQKRYGHTSRVAKGQRGSR